ncbi:MAG TPA: metallophosphoesterase, partial [Candidatus Elarobacter sp.]
EMLGAAILSAWLQYGADGAPHARAVATGACPAATIDGATVPMGERANTTQPFPDIVCDVRVQSDAKRIRVGDRALPAPARQPKTIVVFGDTGCRVGLLFAQACNDPAKWPFGTVARSVAALHPDLIVHVGDYLYREHACPPLADCSGTPHGDDAAAWTADFFAPAAPLFAAAPMVLVRGNHEECSRNGAGWFRYLDAHAETTCSDATAPFAVDLGDLRLVVFDSAAADDRRAHSENTATLKTEFAQAKKLDAGARDSWFVTHRPPYVNADERAAFDDALAPFDAVVTGHIHNFIAVDVEGRPPLVINGIGGAALDPNYAGLLALGMGNLKIAGDPFGSAQFGFGVYTRTGAGWTISLRDPAGTERARCTLAARTVRCRSEAS